MSIADKITSIKQHITNAYTAIQTKGGTIPTNKNIENLNSAITSIATEKPEQSKTATPTKLTQEIVPDSGKVLSKVTIEPIPSQYIIPSGILNISTNGTHDVTSKATVNVNVEAGKTEQEGEITIKANGINTLSPDTGKVFSKVTITTDVQPTLQEKTITPTKLVQSITPDSDNDGLSKVIVNAIPSEYITTVDATATASDLLQSKTAYVKGSKITGSIATYNGSFTVIENLPANQALRAIEPPIDVKIAQNGTKANEIIEVATTDEMTALLNENNVGKFYKYIGETTDLYENGEIYCVEA